MVKAVTAGLGKVRRGEAWRSSRGQVRSGWVHYGWVSSGQGGQGTAGSGKVSSVRVRYGKAVVVRSDRLWCVALRYVLAVKFWRDCSVRARSGWVRRSWCVSVGSDRVRLGKMWRSINS